MKAEYVNEIRMAVENQINQLRLYADIRDEEGNEESRAFFRQESDNLQKALMEFIKENPA